MDDTPAPKKRWELTKEDLDSLLNALNPERELAAIEFEMIRERLIAFFECRGCHTPEDRTDITIYRVAKQISDGTKIRTGKPLNYFLGVAYKVLHEYWRDPSRKVESLDDPSVQEFLSQDNTKVRETEALPSAQEQEMDCLEQCLESLPSADRELIIRYYQNEGKAKIKNRKRLAEQLGIQINALRIRALRIRKSLEECVGERLRGLSKA